MANKPGTRNIVLNMETYDKLKNMKIHERQSFDEVIMNTIKYITKLEAKIEKMEME